MKTEHFTLEHKQIIYWKDGKIKNINCLCKWGSIHRNQWEAGKILCSHVRELMKKLKTKKIRKGYVWIHKPDHKYSLTKKGWIFEHRAVVEDFIKRVLKRNECIHHINHHKRDNRIENLMLFKDHQAHAKFHIKIRQFGQMTNPIKRQIQNRWNKKN